MARKTERQLLLERGEAQGKLKPEHQAELNTIRTAARAAAKTTKDDRMALTKASATAAAERDALAAYQRAAQAVDTFDTGPIKASVLDVASPEPSGGWLDSLGALTVGIPIRGVTSSKTLAARDHLKTINAKIALASSGELKGAASDADMALMRMTGISDYKTKAENKRIISDAARTSKVAQTRAAFTNGWIARFGSLSSASPNGTTFEKGLAEAENNVRTGAHRKAPPSTRKYQPPSGWAVTRD